MRKCQAAACSLVLAFAAAGVSALVVPSLERRRRRQAGHAEDDRLGRLPRREVGQAVREAVRCKIQAKYAATSDEMVTLMRSGGGGQYDMVSASGDASLRLDLRQ